MRRLVIFFCLLCPAAAEERRIELVLPPPAIELCTETLCEARPSPWERREMLGEAMGRVLGMRNGRWDAFSGQLFEDFENGPVIAGTFRKSAAQIQLRWRPGG